MAYAVEAISTNRRVKRKGGVIVRFGAIASGVYLEPFFPVIPLHVAEPA